MHAAAHAFLVLLAERPRAGVTLMPPAWLPPSLPRVPVCTLGGLGAFPHAAVGLSARPHVLGGVCPIPLPVFQPVLVCLSWRLSGSSRSLDGHPVLLVWFTHISSCSWVAFSL